MSLPLPPNTAIAGIGTDIIRIERIQLAFERWGTRFPKRILGDDELQVFKRRYQRDSARGIRYLATRFAAKEAFSKAVGLGIRSPMRWRRVQTLNVAGGRPAIKLSDALETWYSQHFGPAHVSLTDESDMAIAFVIVEQR